jgi:peptide/nickel transport system permease protein
MSRYLVRQALLSVAKLFVFATLMFFFIQSLMPGDFVDQFSMFMNQAERDALRSQLGLDLPIHERYLRWLQQLTTLDLGESLQGGPVNDILAQALPSTLFVFVTGTVLAFLVGLWLGERTAWRGSGVLSKLTTLGGLTLFTTFPPFLAWLLASIFARGSDFVIIGTLAGMRRPSWNMLEREVWKDVLVDPPAVVFCMFLTLLVSTIFFLTINHLFTLIAQRRLPALLLVLLIPAGTVGIWFLLDMQAPAFDILRVSWMAIVAYTLLSFGETMLIMQSSMTEILKEEYINTAQAKGLPISAVREKHAARNALLPALSRLVISLPYLITGIVIIESSLGWPGMGATLWNALYWQDMPVVMAMLLLVGILSMVARLVLDVVIAYSDPRIRYTRQQHRTV